MRRAAGFSLVEVVVATLVMGGLFVAALTAVGASRAGQTVASQRAVGHRLAAELMAEILALPYAEGIALGRDAAESDTLDRTAFDDIDDYAGLSETAPRRRDGSSIDAEGYTRTVDVRWVDPVTPTQDAASESALKRITVTVRWRGRPVAELVALRSRVLPHTDNRIEWPL